MPIPRIPSSSSLLFSLAKEAFPIFFSLQAVMFVNSLIPFASVAAAAHLYVSSYIGTITTLDIAFRNHAYELSTLSVDHAAPANTSFLLLHPPKNVVYCVEEGFGLPNGYISTYKTSRSGKLTQIDRHATLGGPVHQVAYNGGKALAVAH